MSGLSILVLIGIAILFLNWLRRKANGGRAGFRRGANSERKLAKVVGRPAASRLIHQLQQRHPERSRAWCADKALFDWERDRRY